METRRVSRSIPFIPLIPLIGSVGFGVHQYQADMQPRKENGKGQEELDAPAQQLQQA
jgi:hypothetical protein